MTKSIVAGIVALALVLGGGIVEVVVLKKQYEQMHTECVQVIEEANQEQLTVERFNEFRNHWVDLREISELFLPHQDVYEINLRFAEAQAYVEQGDFRQIVAQLSVVEELLRYVPHLMTPNINHLI